MIVVSVTGDKALVDVNVTISGTVPGVTVVVGVTGEVVCVVVAVSSVEVSRLCVVEVVTSSGAESSIIGVDVPMVVGWLGSMVPASSLSVVMVLHSAQFSNSGFTFMSVSMILKQIYTMNLISTVATYSYSVSS